jgi:hypothetical protein
MTAARNGCFDGPMPIISRRVVTGHDDNGVSVFTVDGPVPERPPGRAQPPKTRRTSRDSVTAHSSIAACTNAWGRFPRSCRWCTSYSSV